MSLKHLGVARAGAAFDAIDAAEFAAQKAAQSTGASPVDEIDIAQAEANGAAWLKAIAEKEEKVIDESVELSLEDRQRLKGKIAAEVAAGRMSPAGPRNDPASPCRSSDDPVVLKWASDIKAKAAEFGEKHEWDEDQMARALVDDVSAIPGWLNAQGRL